MTPGFDDGFRDRLEELILWRRDVRRFRGDAVDPALIERLIGLACLSPSVGNSQPWRFVLVEAPACRQAVRASFVSCNSDALHDYHGERARVYATLKLSGLDQAPVHLAVFCERGTETGHGLGRRTMPETLDYSVVAAVQTFWLAARAYGLGVGWVSILDPVAVATALDAPHGWALISYLCVGWPEEEHADPELVRHGWQDRLSTPGLISRR